MNKKQLNARIETTIAALHDLQAGLNGKPFTWGDTERRSKEAYLTRLGIAVVSKSKLEKGGHQLKRRAVPVGKAYYGSPIRKYAELYILGYHTERAIKFYELLRKGKALLEGDFQYSPRKEYGFEHPETDSKK